MIYSDEYKFIYICIPKTASTSITEVLINQFQAKYYNDRHENLIPNEHKNYFVFTSVRHPYCRAISGYKHIKSRDHTITIENCWDRFHMMSMSYYLNHQFKIHERVKHFHKLNSFSKKIQKIHVDKYIKTENLNDEFNKLPFVKNYVKIHTLNKNSMLLDKKILQKICRKVSKDYEEDFLNFNYKKELENDICFSPHREPPIFC